jgi:hypothetical protein
VDAERDDVGLVEACRVARGKGFGGFLGGALDLGSGGAWAEYLRHFGSWSGLDLWRCLELQKGC